ncbi:hypothetical protein COCSUDRAFT_56782 [Coccomyxa subellipsoidea C-169]|uniref:O-fucosyltransferase family protein n=1 Tax=Coccomyxa subellipsoidea (strain C-169) TaxID=574566 RepID=I0YT52_COCSC|nr:hypothetical protein COCSUDRAFT_56782 [Coccomyxa subellipsoidea C-169]EIE21571.1 hypothetical protein COCSUDRAFT_56782 [Coccomyxa subellipsoidea C-169]|eukprot:XP_005646115.1 hypothetical protein COCSUDRAFT_56782 [Coccomyxa subellipsoidea C-169]
MSEMMVCRPLHCSARKDTPLECASVSEQERQHKGFAANAVHILHAYTVFSQNNGTLYLNSTEFQYKCANEGGWHDFFDFSSTNGSMAKYSAEAEQQEPCARYTFHDVDLMLHNMKYDWFSIDTAAAKKVWTFTKWVQDELDAVLEELAQMPAPRMGFHIRGGDKLSEDVQLSRMTTRPEDFVTNLAEAFPDLKGGTCIMVGDDQEWIAQASKIAAATFGCKPFSKTLFHIPTGGSHDQETFNHENFETKCAGTLQFLVDIEFLNHADYFVGTTNSGLPHIVDVLRFAVYNKDRSTFVDASFRHQDWYSRMRRFWQSKGPQPKRRLLRSLWRT